MAKQNEGYIEEVFREKVKQATAWDLQDYMDEVVANLSELDAGTLKGRLWLTEEDFGGPVPEEIEKYRIIHSEIVERLEEWDGLLTILGNFFLDVIREGKLSKATAREWLQKVVDKKEKSEDDS